MNTFISSFVQQVLLCLLELSECNKVARFELLPFICLILYIVLRLSHPCESASAVVLLGPITGCAVLIKLMSLKHRLCRQHEAVVIRYRKFRLGS
jgi:hypothetical protein